jgi:hypothetical protein
VASPLAKGVRPFFDETGNETNGRFFRDSDKNKAAER